MRTASTIAAGERNAHAFAGRDDPASIAGVHDEPTLARRDEPRPAVLQLGFLHPGNCRSGFLSGPTFGRCQAPLLGVGARRRLRGVTMLPQTLRDADVNRIIESTHRLGHRRRTMRLERDARGAANRKSLA